MNRGVGAALVTADHNDFFAFHLAPFADQAVMDGVFRSGKTVQPRILKFPCRPDDKAAAHRSLRCVQLKPALRQWSNRDDVHPG